LNLPAAPFISVVIPNHNGEKTIGPCLEAALASTYPNFELVVVDDCSSDGSAAVIENYPCRLIQLQEHGGASVARNAGASNSRGGVLFFIDADCLLQPDTLTRVSAAYTEYGPETIIGGTYTLLPFDQDFFSAFQSVYIHYSETKSAGDPDYIATHAMIIGKKTFSNCGGFKEDFMPILEDVEFSHRLKKSGYILIMDPTILVQHIFNFSFIKSMRNAIRKTKYWSIYSMQNKDLLADSGTASREFKFNVLACFANLLLLVLLPFMSVAPVLGLIVLIASANLSLNRKLIRAFGKARGPAFAFFALLYYTCVYPFAVGIGALSAIYSHSFGSGT
jgi:glycosyltransferase involved in cell wall biosynthesis